MNSKLAEEINHLDFDIFCGCKEREVIKPPRLFGLIPPVLGKYITCGRVARYSSVSRCCGEQTMLCRAHRLSDSGWVCLRCRHTSSSIDSALVIYAL